MSTELEIIIVFCISVLIVFVALILNLIFGEYRE